MQNTPYRIIILNWLWNGHDVLTNTDEINEEAPDPTWFNDEKEEINTNWLTEQVAQKWDKSWVRVVGSSQDLLIKTALSMEDFLEEENSIRETQKVTETICRKVRTYFPDAKQFNVLFMLHEGFSFPKVLENDSAPEEIDGVEINMKYCFFSGNGEGEDSSLTLLYGEKGFLSHNHGEFFKGVLNGKGEIAERDNFDNVWRHYSFQTRNKVEELYDQMMGAITACQLDATQDIKAHLAQLPSVNEFVQAAREPLAMLSEDKRSFLSSKDLYKIMQQHPSLLQTLESVQNKQVYDLNTLRKEFTGLLADDHLV